MDTADTYEPGENPPTFHTHTMSLDEQALMLPSCMTILQPTWVLMNSSPRLKSISGALNMMIAHETDETKPFPITTVLKHIAPGDPHIDILVSSTCLLMHPQDEMVLKCVSPLVEAGHTIEYTLVKVLASL